MEIKNTAVCHVPSNFSDKELVNLIETNYPNLNGPLLVMFTRFSKTVENDNPKKLTGVCSCPHCGSVLKL